MCGNTDVAGRHGLLQYPDEFTGKTVCHIHSTVVCTLTPADVMQCVATVMMLAGVVFFSILNESLGEIVQHACIQH